MCVCVCACAHWCLHTRLGPCLHAIVWGWGDESGKSISEERSSINKNLEGGQLGPVFGERWKVCLHVVLSILWIFGSLSLPTRPACVCNISTKECTNYICCNERVLSTVYEDNFFQFFYGGSEIISWRMIKAHNLFFWGSWLLAPF